MSPSRKPGLTPDSTWIEEQPGDEPDDIPLEDDTPSPDGLEFLEPEMPPIHDAVFFGLASLAGPLQLDDLRTGKSLGVFPGLGATLKAARHFGMTRCGIRVLRRGA